VQFLHHLQESSGWLVLPVSGLQKAVTTPLVNQHDAI